MQIKVYVEVLEKLSALDAELKELGVALGERRAKMEGKTTHLASLEERATRAQSSVHDMERARAELLQEFRQLGVQVEKSREKLARCRNEREANAAQREVEEVRKLHKDRESEIEKLANLATHARGDLENVGKERDALRAELEGISGEITGQVNSLESELRTKTAERETLVKALAPALYRRYEMIRKRRGSALAYTSTDGTCSACHITLRPMMLHKLKLEDAFADCPSCQRIIYYRLPEPTLEPTND